MTRQYFSKSRGGRELLPKLVAMTFPSDLTFLVALVLNITFCLTACLNLISAFTVVALRRFNTVCGYCQYIRICETVVVGLVSRLVAAHRSTMVQNYPFGNSLMSIKVFMPIFKIS